MPYNSIISRTDAAALIPESVSAEILSHVPQQSAVLTLARKLRPIPRAQSRMPVMSALATAYFVNGDSGLKQTTEVNWANKYVDAEEIAAIVPIPESVLDDAEGDPWGEIQGSIEEAIGIVIDKAVMYGTNIPASWTTNMGAAGLVAGALAAGHNVSLAGYTDMYEAILGESPAGVSGMFGFVEDDGFMVSGSIATLAMKRRLRNVRDSNGQPIFSPNMQQPGNYTLDGAPCQFPLNGSVSATYYLLGGQWNQLVYAMRQDISYKILDQAVITDNTGAILYNLAQQDMVAMRVVVRLGVALPNPVNRVNPTDATRFPFAYLTA